MRKPSFWIMCVALCGLIAFGACKSDPADKTPFSTTYTGEPIAALKKFIADKKISTSADAWRLKLPKPPKVRFDAKKKYFWNLDTTKGKIVIELMADVAPMHVSSTVYLTILGFYDGLTFHRIIKGFMAQGGDPKGNGSGGPGYQYGAEFSPKVRHDRGGLLSMANAGPHTDGSQFFLTFAATSWLNDKHTIFGEVKEGMDVLKELEKLGSQTGKVLDEPEIKKATITVK